MSALTRRGFLHRSGLTMSSVGLALGGGSALVTELSTAPRAWAGTGCDGPAVEPYGIASTSASLVGMTVLEGFGYVVTRNQDPAKLGEIDLTTRELTRFVELETGASGWAMTASGGKVYAGTEPEPDLHSFDPQTGEVSRLGRIGPLGGVVWCLATAPDGTVYAGTYPRGEVWEYSPATGELRNLGVAVEGQQYVRSIAADETSVYAGTLPVGHIIAFDRTTGEKRDITPPVEATPSIYTMIMAGDRVVGAAGRQLLDVRPDGSDPRYVSVPEGGPVDALAVGPDGTLYGTSRPSGTVYRREGDVFAPIAIPSPEDQHRGLAAVESGDMLVSATGTGGFWWLDLAEASSVILDLGDTPLAGPELPQSIAVDPGRAVYVGGNRSITIHDPWRGDEPHRLRVEGEPKQMRMVRGRLYVALYPRGVEILELSRGGSTRSYGRVGNGQLRPLDLEFDAASGLMLLGTAPVNGELAGALTLFRPGHRELEVHLDPLHDRRVSGIAVEDGAVYLAGDATGVSVEPTQESGIVAAYDVASRTVLWETAPIPGDRGLFRIGVLDGIVYGLYKSGAWFAMEAATQTVLHQGEVESRGEVYVHRGHVYASVRGGTIYRLGPDLPAAEPVITGLEDRWYNAPQLAFEPTGWYAWGLTGFELARLRLDPSCPGSTTA